IVDDDGDTLRTASARLADHLRRLADDPDRRLRDPARPPRPRSCPTGPNLEVTPPCADDLSPDATVVSRFADVVRVHPDRVAVREGDHLVTYRELDALGRELTVRLAADGIGPGHTVGVRFERCLDGVVAMLGVVLAGAAYVPLDDQAPAERIAAVVD